MNLMLSLSLAAALATGAYAPQRAGTDPLDPAREARVQQLGKQLRCAVCQGVSIADSPASMARAQLDKVRELVEQGRSDEEIRQYFVARYGEWVLLAPPAHGANLIVWFGPGLIVLGGAFFIWKFVRDSARSPEPKPAAASAATSPSSPTAPPADPYLDAVRAELER